MACNNTHLKQEIGPKKREEDDGGTAKDDEFHHGEDQPGQQQASTHKVLKSCIWSIYIFELNKLKAI